MSRKTKESSKWRLRSSHWNLARCRSRGTLTIKFLCVPGRVGIESPVEMDSREKKGEGWEVVKTGLF